MAAVRTLFARSSQGRFHLRHRRLFFPRHHARRRHADRGDGRHERLSQGTAGQDPRAQRPFAGAAAGIAFDRLEGCRRAHQPGAGHPPCGPGRRRPGAGVLGVQRLRRPGPRHARRRSERPVLDFAEHQAGLTGEFRRRAGRRDRPQARRSIVAARRRQHHAGGAKGGRDPDGHDAADKTLQDRRRVRDRHVGIRLRPSCSCRCRRRRPISTARTT